MPNTIESLVFCRAILLVPEILEQEGPNKQLTSLHSNELHKTPLKWQEIGLKRGQQRQWYRQRRQRAAAVWRQREPRQSAVVRGRLYTITAAKVNA